MKPKRVLFRKHQRDFRAIGALSCIPIVFIIYWLTAKDNKSLEEPQPNWKLSPLWSEDGQPHVNPHPFRFLNNQPDFCSVKSSVDLLILVSSAVSHIERRDAIRSTWGSKAYLSPFRAKVLFLLGQGQDKQTITNDESQLYQDIIQEDFHDIYHNLTLKTVMGLKWSAIFCPQAKFIMKTDDDIFVNVGLLQHSLKSEFKHIENVLGCSKNFRGAPLPIPSDSSNGMVFTPGHPEFVAGAGYVIPGKIVSDLYLATLSTRLIPVEDAFTTGYCAKKIGHHPPHHDSRFSCGEMVPNDCDMVKKFTGHKISPDRQFAIFEAVTKAYLNCRQHTEY